MTPAAKLAQSLVGGPLNRANLSDVERGIQIARAWLDVRPSAPGRGRYLSALARLEVRRDQLLDDREAAIVASVARARIESERRLADRERLAGLARKKRANAAAIRDARVAEVAQARGLVALAYLDALLEHHQAIDAWQAEDDGIPKCGNFPPITKLDRLETEHGARHRELLKSRVFTGVYGNADVRPLEAWPTLGRALDALALVAWKLEHSSARGDEHFVTRRVPGKITRSWDRNWEVACRYCGEVIGDGGPGTVHTSSSHVRRHSTVCAIQYLAGMIPGIPPGQRPAKGQEAAP